MSNEELPLRSWTMKLSTNNTHSHDEADPLLAQLCQELNGRLLPPGGDRKAEYSVPDQDVPMQYTLGAMTLQEATAKAAKTGRPVVIRYVTKWDDGRYHIEPWQPL